MFYHNWDLTCSYLLFLSSPFPFFFFIPTFFSPPSSHFLWHSVRDTWCLWLLLMWSVRGYLNTLTPSHWCERCLYQANLIAATETDSVKEQRWLWGILRRFAERVTSGSDSVAEPFDMEKGEIVLRNWIGCGKGDLFGVIALFFLNSTLALNLFTLRKNSPHRNRKFGCKLFIFYFLVYYTCTVCGIYIISLDYWFF